MDMPSANHPDECAQVRAALGELIDLASRELSGLQVEELRDQVLGGLIASVGEHCAALIKLSEGLAARSCEVLLRSIVDAWIIAHYVATDNSTERARSYALRGLTENRRFWHRLKQLAESDTEHANEHLRRANMASRDDLDRQIATLDAKIAVFRQSGIATFPSLADCARQLGHEFEYMYLWFYGFLLSDRSHLGPRTVLAYLSSNEYDPSSRVRQIRQVLASALALHLDLLRLASQRFGHPSEKQLSRFEELLDEEQRALEGQPGHSGRGQ